MPFSGNLLYRSALVKLDQIPKTLQNGNVLKAEIIQDMETSLRWDSRNPFVWSRLARVKATFRVGDPASIVNAFDHARLLAPRHAPFAVEEGFFQLGRGELDDADHAFRDALELEPNTPVPFYGRALVAMHRNQRSEAVSFLRRALELHQRYSNLAQSSDYARFLFAVDVSELSRLVEQLL
jgi:Tfp pilus assembly protein PilF